MSASKIYALQKFTYQFLNKVAEYNRVSDSRAYFHFASREWPKNQLFYQILGRSLA